MKDRSASAFASAFASASSVSSSLSDKQGKGNGGNGNGGNGNGSDESTLIQQALAWSVHLYTGLGLLINVYSIHAALYASPEPDFTLFCRLNWLAILVDATDGTMARYFNVKRHASAMDGALLDNIIDFQTFSLLPALAVCIFDELTPPHANHDHGDHVSTSTSASTSEPGGPSGRLLPYTIAAMILIASGYQFCQCQAKTTQAFVGFPSYWNLVVFYIYYLQPTFLVRMAMFVGFAALSFCPIHFIYPTRTKRFFRTTMIGAYLWGILMVIPTMIPEWEHSILCMKLSLIYVVYYFGLSLYLDYERRRTTTTTTKTTTSTKKSE